jgi:hypothetical protein
MININDKFPEDAIRLFYDKFSAKMYNFNKLKSLKTEQHLCTAIDVIRGVGTKFQKDYLLKKAVEGRTRSIKSN